MEGLPDRHPREPLILGSADWQLPEGSYAAAASGEWQADGNRGSTNTPGLSKDSSRDLIETYFDLHAYYQEDITDATSHSDDGNSFASPSVETVESSLEGPALDSDNDIIMTDDPHDKLRDKLPWPKEGTGTSTPQYNQTLPHDDFTLPEAPPSPVSSLQITQSVKLASRARNPATAALPSPGAIPAANRTRTLADSGKTSKVREIGACLHCKISRVGVSALVSTP